MDQSLKQKYAIGTTDTILMVEPVAFGYNPQTAVNNYFQQNENRDGREVQEKALAEFNGMVAKLREAGVHVIVMKDTAYPHTPDSIFPNNWVSFHLNNKAVFYPMFAENRRFERRMDVLLLVENHLGRQYELVDLSHYELQGCFLEGTGSIVPDRVNRIAYACLSTRTDKDLFIQFCEKIDFTPVYFTATNWTNNERVPIYHTNVMMCVGDTYVVVCLDTVENREERENLVNYFNKTGKEIVEITLEQMEHFAGNMLQIRNNQGESLLAMSRSAYDSLHEKQIKTLESKNKLLVFTVPTIEKNGGGSVRCMMCEVF